MYEVVKYTLPSLVYRCRLRPAGVFLPIPEPPRAEHPPSSSLLGETLPLIPPKLLLLSGNHQRVQGLLVHAQRLLHAK